ncbi:lipase secretion chaperone [Marinobacter shengliensis]|uniref:lipase secretion chaperone n=1 Tax=Marinobacter shengliensis TaxID=1389223 RepID=UPI000D1047F4|nr:lipase secretion chaperone [Marinobacter shengliensis]PSF14555.1 lipase chaperone [Marinobacter shengliensis]
MTNKPIALRRWVLPGALLAVVAGSGLWWALTPQANMVTANTTPQQATEKTAQPSGSASHDGAPVDAPTPSVTGTRTPESLGPNPFAPSLQGTDIDGVLQADDNGQLVVNLEVRDFFDYFLSTVGEVSPETAIGQIQQMARQHLPEPAAQQALALLDQYLAYKQASLEVMQTELDPARQHEPAYQLSALGNALAQLKGLRQQTFAPDAHQAFFGMEEAYSEYTLATLAIQQRADLTDQGKQALVEWHRNQLPDTLKSTEQRLEASAQQHQERVLAVESATSPEAAGQRLTELGLDRQSVDGVVSYLQQQEAFQARFESFRKDLQSSVAGGLVDAEQQQHQEQLLQQHFQDEQEQTWARLKLLDQS